MKKILILISVLLINTLSVFAQYRPQVVVNNLYNITLTNNAQNAIADLFYETSKAFAYGTKPVFASLKIDQATKGRLENLWETSPFRLDATKISESAIKKLGQTGYEIRNIPVVFKEGTDKTREVSISFNTNGVIDGFNITLTQNCYKHNYSSRNVTDLRRAQQIKDYVEQFRTSYCTKDMKFLQQVFSDDALIIVGNVVQQVRNNDSPKTNVRYITETKKQYLDNLQRVFNNNKRINVQFENIEIHKHPTLDDWFYVKLKQGWSADRYHDEGYVFLLWDFRDNDRPQIHVRVWQQDDNKITEDDIFDIDDLSF